MLRKPQHIHDTPVRIPKPEIVMIIMNKWILTCLHYAMQPSQTVLLDVKFYSEH